MTRVKSGDLPLLVRMAPWSLALPVLKFVLPLQSLTRLMWHGRPRARDLHREQTIVALSRKLARRRPLPGRDNCLERSLLAYRFLSAAGADPSLALGVRRTRESVEGHAWVILDGRPIHDDVAALAEFVPLAQFGAGGSPSGPSSSAATSRAAQLNL